jgi:membrane associated rhomboid family serine protease
MSLTVKCIIYGSLAMVLGFILYSLIAPNLNGISDKVQVAQGAGAVVGMGAATLLLSMWVWKIEKENRLLKRQLHQTSGNPA